MGSSRFAGKSVIVTGAAQGIGLAYARDASVVAMVAGSTEPFGGIDVLVNNAGLHMGQYNLTSTLPLDDWRRLFDVNVFGAVLCARECRRSMAERGAPTTRRS